MKTYLILSLLLLTGCGTTGIHTRPLVPNRCELDATNMQVVQDARNYLDPTFHSRILVVRYLDNGVDVGHAYCLWRAKGLFYAYDATGTRHLLVGTMGSTMPDDFAVQLKENVIAAWYEGEKGHEYIF